jgi:porin
MKKAIQSSPVFLLALSVSFVLSTTVRGGDAQVSAPEAASAPAEPSGILPLPDYSGDFFERAYLMRDFGGKRSEWAEKGFTFDINYNQYVQGVVDGGVDTGSRYGGTIDYNLTLDFDRMGLIPGGLLQARAVSRYGRSVNDLSGALIPVNTDATHPTTSSLDDEVGLYLPMITYTQFLSEKLALSVGKFDTYDSLNEFAGGRGRSQWWNLHLAMPASGALIVPYSMLAGAVIVMPSPNLSITAMVGTSQDTSDNSGFDYLDEGLMGLLIITYQYQCGDLPGGFTLLPAYGWNGDFNEINGRINVPEGILTPSTKDDTWFISYDHWQYLWLEEGKGQAVDTSDGRQDLQGVGVFGRIQFAEYDTNPVGFYISAGVSAKGLIPNRDNDTMGIAYNYNSVQDTRFGGILGIDDSSTVLEAYYNIEISPAMHLTLDAQVSDSALPGADTAVILGTSMQLRF